jgi:hypothetical protein
MQPCLLDLAGGTLQLPWQSQASHVTHTSPQLPLEVEAHQLSPCVGQISRSVDTPLSVRGSKSHCSRQQTCVISKSRFCSSGRRGELFLELVGGRSYGCLGIWLVANHIAAELLPERGDHPQRGVRWGNGTHCSLPSAGDLRIQPQSLCGPAAKRATSHDVKANQPGTTLCIWFPRISVPSPRNCGTPPRSVDLAQIGHLHGRQDACGFPTDAVLKDSVCERIADRNIVR